MDHNRELSGDIEFVLVDFGSTDGFKDWINSNFANERSSGYLKVFATNEMSSWHMSKAKNTTHINACGDILVNLDADNFTGPQGAAYVLQQFNKFGRELLLHQFSGDFQDGSCGRISVVKEFFYTSGGYDQSFKPLGYDDIDFIRRLQALGLNYKRSPDNRYNRSIQNSKSESLMHCDIDMSWEQMDIWNANMSLGNILAGNFVANLESSPGISGCKILD